MHAQPASQLLNPRDRIADPQPHKLFRPTFHNQILLLVRINANNAERHTSGGQLHSQMAQPATCAEDGDELAGLGARFAQGCIGGYARAEHRRCGGRVEGVGDRGYVVGRAEDVLLEGAGGVVAADLCWRTAGD